MHRRDRDKVSRLPETVMLGVSLLVVLAIAALSYQSGNQAQAADQQLKISRATLDLCQDLLSTLKDAETGQRGFLLTGKEHYLEPYSQALTAIPEMLRKLHIQALQRPDQTQRLKALDGLISAKLAELKDTIELRRSGRAEEALAIVDGGNGKALMDEIRDRSAIMDKVAEDRLSQFSAEAGRSTARLRWVSTSGSALLLVFLCLAALTTFRGMTRREQLYSQAYASQKLLGTTLSSIADGVITTDPAGNITFLNPVAEKLTGWATAEASGVHITSVFVIVNETSGLPVENPLQRALQEGTAVGLANHTSLIVKNGEQRSIDDTAAPIRDEDGNIVGAVLVFRDISAKRVAQRELANSALALKRSNEELQHFAYVAAHDLRSPLQSTNAVAQLMAKRFGDKLGPDGNELVAYITDGVNRMARLVDDLLIFARAGDLSGAPACPVPMAEVVGKSLTNLDAEIQATGARITFDPLPTIVARETQMLQLMQNIVGNALKYRGTDPAVVHISGAQKDTQWIFSVRDNGVGIDPKYAQDVFQPFKRLHGPEYQGSGIGLATCKKIVAAYGGRIWVESEAGKGATFFFTIPMEEDQDIQPPQSASA